MNTLPLEHAHIATLNGARCKDYKKTRKVAILLLKITLAIFENDRPAKAMAEVEAQSLLTFEGAPHDVPQAARLIQQSALVLATILCGGQRHD